MKTKLFLFIIVVLASIIPLKSQVNRIGVNGNKTLNKKSKKQVFMNGTVWMGYTTTKCQLYYYSVKNPTIFYGGSISYTLWHRVNVGFSMARFSNKFSSHWQWSEFSDWVRYMNGYYGGVFIEPVIFPKFPVHISFPMIIGAGKIEEHIDYFQSYWPATYVIEEGHTMNSKSFLIFEPGIEIELNVLKYFRLGVGAKYSITNRMKIESNFNSDYSFSAPIFNLSLKFGKF